MPDGPVQKKKKKVLTPDQLRDFYGGAVNRHKYDCRDVLDTLLNMLLFDQMVADGLWTAAHRKEVLRRIRAPAVLDEPMRMFATILELGRTLYRSEKWSFHETEWPLYTFSYLTGRKGNSNSMSLMDALFFHSVNSLDRVECPRSAKRQDCLDVFCPLWHPDFETAAEEPLFESMVSLSLTALEFRFGIISKGNFNNIA